MRPNLLSIATALTLLASAAPELQAQQQVSIRNPNPRKAGDVCSGLSFSILPNVSSGTLSIVGYPVIIGISANSPAAAAGLAIGDSLLRIGNKAGNEQGALKFEAPGVSVPMTVKRGSEEHTLTFVSGVLVERNPDDTAPGLRCSVVPAKQP
jgi:S1-C subfamily serine protease